MNAAQLGNTVQREAEYIGLQDIAGRLGDFAEAMSSHGIPECQIPQILGTYLGITGQNGNGQASALVSGLSEEGI